MTRSAKETHVSQAHTQRETPGEAPTVEYLTREEYLVRLRQLEEGKQDLAKSFDQSIVALAGGALGLSMTFVERFAPAPQSTWFLGASWVSFVLALLAVLVSYEVGQAAYREEQDILQQAMDGNHKALDAEPRYTRWTARTNRLAIGFLVLGLLALARFVYINLP